jgi:hypothetical protein
MNARELLKHTLANFKAGNTVIWKSDPGAGKTDLTFTLFERLKRAFPGKRVGMGRIFMATSRSVDSNGLPAKSTRDFGDGKLITITDPAIPRWAISTEGLPCTMYDIYFLVMEEWGQGEPDTRKAFASLALEHGVPGFYMPEPSFVLMLTNLDSRDGVNKEFDFLINRREELTLDSDVDVWDEDFASKPQIYNGIKYQVLPAFRTWAKSNPVVACEPKPKIQGPWCSFRSLTASSRYTENVSELDEHGNMVIPLDDPCYVQGMTGHIGTPAAQSLLSYLRFRLDLPQYQDVVADPEGCEVPSRADLHMLMAYELAYRCKPEHVGECITYMSRDKMPHAMRLAFVTTLLRKDYKSVINHPAMQAFINKNAGIIHVLNQLS